MLPVSWLVYLSIIWKVCLEEEDEEEEEDEDEEIYSKEEQVGQTRGS